MSKELLDRWKGRVDRRGFLKGLGILASVVTLDRLTGAAQGEPQEESCPINIEIANVLVKLRRPEQKFTIYFDLIVEMPEGTLVEAKHTVRIIRAIKRKMRKKEEIIFIPVIARKRNVSDSIVKNRIEAVGEENVLIDLSNICSKLRYLSGIAFAVEIFVEARGVTFDKGAICSASKLAIDNFDVDRVCKR